MADSHSRDLLGLLQDIAARVTAKTGLPVTVEPFEGAYAITVERPDGLMRHGGYGFDAVHGMLLGIQAATVRRLAEPDWAIAEVARLRAGEESGYTPEVEATPGQWLWRLHQAPAGERLEVIGRLLESTRHVAQLQDLLRVANETSNRSESERANAAARASQALAAIERVQALHRPVDYRGLTICAQCSGFDGQTCDNSPCGYEHCPTLEALGDPSPRLLDCGFCYEEQGEEVHPHPECPEGRRNVIRLETALHTLRFALDRFTRARFNPAPEYLRGLLDAVTEDPGEPCDSAEQHARALKAEAALDRVRAESARIRAVTPTWGPVADLIDAALEGPVREQRERPTHSDGTPYRYSEIVAEGWGFCDGCRMWSTANSEIPHQCSATHLCGPVGGKADDDGDVEVVRG